MLPVPLKVKASLLVPPVTFWMLVKAFAPLASVSVPALDALIAQVLATLLPVSVLVPVPPSIVPLMLPVPLNVNASLFEPPVTFVMPVKTFAPLASVSVPALDALIAQVLATLLPVSVFVPAPPLIVPLMLPVPLNVKASLLVPPVRFVMPEIGIAPLRESGETAVDAVSLKENATLLPVGVLVPVTP